MATNLFSAERPHIHPQFLHQLSPWRPDSSKPLSPGISFLPDINSDGVLDEQELEALFTKEVSVLEAFWARHMLASHAP